MGRVRGIAVPDDLMMSLLPHLQKADVWGLGNGGRGGGSRWLTIEAYLLQSSPNKLDEWWDLLGMRMGSRHLMTLF